MPSCPWKTLIIYYWTKLCNKKCTLHKKPQETADLVTFTEEILNGKRHFLCSGICLIIITFISNIY